MKFGFYKYGFLLSGFFAFECMKRHFFLVQNIIFKVIKIKNKIEALDLKKKIKFNLNFEVFQYSYYFKVTFISFKVMFHGLR